MFGSQNQLGLGHVTTAPISARSEAQFAYYFRLQDDHLELELRRLLIRR